MEQASLYTGSIPITVNGNIISELSSKIPTSFVALNELIKNAYDANADNVDIIFDENRRYLSILDDGNGMNIEDIQGLFNIGKSKKSYGSSISYIGKDGIQKIRYTQGSKGLGFLAALKFGNKVTWTSRKGEREIQFEISDKKRLIESVNISNENIPFKQTNILKKGTLIQIQEIDDDNLELLSSIFTADEERDVSLITNAFYRDSLKISVRSSYANSKNLSLKDIHNFLPKNQIFHVDYNSQSGYINFYKKDTLCHTEAFPHDCSNFSINLDLVIYDLSGSRNAKDKISKLFTNTKGELSPQIYVNENLFDNNELFDPNINRTRRSYDSLPQMIGYVRIFCSDGMIDFNSDRTQFVQNKLTEAIKKCLYSLNQKIQIVGSKLKREREAEDSSLSGDTPIAGTLTPQRGATLLQCRSGITQYVPSTQVNLYELLKVKIDSNGNDIPNDKITIEVDDASIELHDGVLPSITTAAQFNIIYKYVDAQNGLAVAQCPVVMKERPVAPTTSPATSPLIPILYKPGYSFSVPVVQNIISQIEYAYQTDKRGKKLIALIACSLRSIFEIFVEQLEKQGRIKFAASKVPIEIKVYFFIERCKKSDQFVTLLDNKTNAGYNTFLNILIPEHFWKGVKICHVGAHKSTTYLTYIAIEDVGKLLGIFCLCASEWLKATCPAIEVSQAESDSTQKLLKSAKL